MQVTAETEVWCAWVLSNGTFCPQALSQRGEKLRPLLFRLASEAVADEEALGKSQPCPGAAVTGLCPSCQGTARVLGTLWAKLSPLTMKPCPVAFGLFLLILRKLLIFTWSPKLKSVLQCLCLQLRWFSEVFFSCDVQRTEGF